MSRLSPAQNGTTVNIGRDTQGNATTYADASNGATYNYTYSSTFDRIASISDPIGRRANFSYDAKGEVTQILDAQE